MLRTRRRPRWSAPSSGGSSFSPTQIAGLQAWWDASDSSTITSSSSAVSQWRDKSGNARHLAQATGSKQPLTATDSINGLNVLKFDGVDDIMTTSSFIYGLGACTVFVVCKGASQGSDHRIVAEGSTGSTTPMYCPLGNGATTVTRERFFIRDNASTQTTAEGTAVFLDSVPKISCFKDTGSAVTLYLNSTSDATVASYTRSTTTLDTLAIGALKRTTESNWFVGDIAEIIVYNTALSDANRDLVETYLYAKWYQAVDAMFLIGQSNADGRGDNTMLPSDLATFYATTPPNMYIWYKPAVRDANGITAGSYTNDGGSGSGTPFFQLDKGHNTGTLKTHQVVGDQGSTVAGQTQNLHGSELAYGYAYTQAATGKELYIFKGCCGGTAIETNWGVSNADPTKIYYWFKTYIYQPGYKELLRTGKWPTIKVIFWMQGETDADNAMPYATYKGYLQTLVNRLKTEYCTQNPLIAIGGLSTGYNTTNGNAIKQAQIDVAAANTNCVVLYTDGSDGQTAFPLQVDNIHYTPDGFKMMGLKLAHLQGLI